MSNRWVTVDRKSEKQQSDIDRRARRKEEARQAALELATAVGGQAQQLVGGGNLGGHQSAAAARRKAAAEAAAAAAAQARQQSRQDQIAIKKKEEEKNARRRAAAERSKSTRDPSLWPLTASELIRQQQDLRAVTLKALEGIPGADCSFVRALYACNTLDKALQRTVATDDAAAFANSKFALPYASILDDHDATKAASLFSSKFLKFGVDGDAETMLRLLTSVFGEKGAREDCAKSVGTMLAVQMLLSTNVVEALDACALVANTFLAVNGNGKFHSQASMLNFMTVAFAVALAVSREAESCGPDARCFSILQVKNAFVAILRALSNDGCGRWGSEEHAASLVQLIASTLELLGDMEAPSDRVLKKSDFTPLLSQDCSFVVGLARKGLVDGHVGKVLATELLMDHAPETARLLFCPALTDLQNAIADVGAEKAASSLDWLIGVLALVVEERGAEVFPSWSEVFSKCPDASSLVLVEAVARGATIDAQFMEKVKARLEKRAASSPTEMKAGIDAVNLVARRGNVAKVEKKVPQQKTRDEAAKAGSSQARQREATAPGSAGSSIVVSLLKALLVIGATYWVFTASAATRSTA